MNFSLKQFFIFLGVIALLGALGAVFWMNQNHQVGKSSLTISRDEKPPPPVTPPPLAPETTPPAPVSLPEPPVSENPTPPLAPTGPSAPPVFRHVFIVVEENHSYEDVIGNTHDMPYLNSLANSYAYAKQYYADTHPSIGNYFMLTVGKILTNADSFGGTVNDDNIVRRLLAAHKTWKEYSQTLPSVGYIGGDADPYEQHHNPLSYFSDVRSSQTQRQNLVPIGQLKTDIANHTLPNFGFIVPDNFHDGHDCPHGSGCPKSDKLKATDDWLKGNLDTLIQSSDFTAAGGGLLIITFDEAAKSDKIGGGGHVAWVVVGPGVKRGYTSTAWYQHQSTLRLLLESLGITTLPGKAEDAAPMQEFIQKR